VKYTTIKKGNLFILTEGAYSEFYVAAICIALEDIDEEKLKKEYKQFKKENEFNYREKTIFQWLLDIRKCAKEFNFGELWVENLY